MGGKMEAIPKSTLSAVLLLTALLSFSACGAVYHGSPSDHFDGSRFFNSEPDHTFKDMVKWWLEMETVPWPKWIEDPKQPPPVDRVEKDCLRVTYINHATLLIQMNGLNILTDPIWSMRAGPIKWIGPKRVRAPGVKLSDLPPIDVVLISHDHYDHLDLQTLRKIIHRHEPIILAGLGVKALLEDRSIHNVVELDWWRSYESGTTDIRFTFVPARHQSGRLPFNRNRTLWGGFVIEGAIGQVYFAGDTAFGDFIHAVRKRFRKIKLAILPIGSYEKRWFMKSQHMNPDDAVRTQIILGARQSMGCHYSTFAEHPEQTIDTHEINLADALERYGISPSRFWILKFGESREITSE